MAVTLTNGGMEGVINLSKGGKINLTKETPSLKKIMVGLGWDCNEFDNGYDFDLDASVFLVNKGGITRPQDFIFYNNLKAENGCVVHQGDNRTGNDDEDEGDAEQIYIDLDLVPSDIEKIAVVVTIDRADERHQNFGQVSNAYCRLVDNTTDKEVVHFDLGEDFSVETAIVVGEVYRHNEDWKFNAVGSGFSGGLVALCRHFGLDAAYM